MEAPRTFQLQVGTGEAVRTKRGQCLCPVSAQCIVGFDVVSPRVGCLLCSFVLIPQ